MLKIGIDPGIKTGVAAISKGKIILIETTTILAAFKTIDRLVQNHDLSIYVEDARQRGGRATAALGAGSVIRDCKIWEEYLGDLSVKYAGRVRYFFLKPNAKLTKLDSARFKKITRHTGKTSNHSRDAAMLVWCI